jgi:hypothetical protein
MRPFFCKDKLHHPANLGVQELIMLKGFMLALPATNSVIFMANIHMTRQERTVNCGVYCHGNVTMHKLVYTQLDKFSFEWPGSYWHNPFLGETQ